MKAAIIGCGFVAPAHISCLQRLRGIEIVGVADIDIATARKVAEAFRIPKAFADIRSLLVETTPEVIHLLTPPQTHAELAIEAMQAGCHVLLEKPMAPCVEEANMILTSAQQHNVKLALCHNFLFIPCIVAARKLLRGGDLGKLIGVDIAWKPAARGLNVDWTRDLPGGAMHEILPHPVYLQRAFVGELDRIAGISTRGGDSRGPSCEIRILLDAQLGTSQIEVSPGAEPKQIWMRIEGTKMSLHVDLSSNTMVRVRKLGHGKLAKALMNIDQAVQLLGETIGNAFTLLRGGISNGHFPLIEAFYRSLREGTEPPVTGEDGRATVAILDQIWKTTDRH